MINAYCENFKEAFARAVHYGVLSEEDAQCFSVQLSIESGFFVLLGGTAILAVVTTFVTKACVQYFREVDTTEKENACLTSMSDSGFTHTDSDDCDSVPIDAGFSARIDPVPVLFTDSFRWMLHACPSSPPDDLFCHSGEHWDLPEARAVAYDEDIGASVAQGRFLHDEFDLNKTSKNTYSPESKATSTYPSPAAATARRQLAFDDEISTMQGSIMESVSSQSLESDEWRSSISRNSRKANLKDDMTYATPPGGVSRMKSRPAQELSTPTISNGNAPSLALSISRSVLSSTASRSHGSTGPRSLPSPSNPSSTSTCSSRSRPPTTTTPFYRQSPRSLASPSNPSSTAGSTCSSRSRPPTTTTPSFRQSKSRSLGDSSSAVSDSSSKRVPKESFHEELSMSEKQTVEELLLSEEELGQGIESQSQSEYMEETVDGDEFEEYTVQTMSEILEEYDVYEDYSDYDDDRSRQVI